MKKLLMASVAILLLMMPHYARALNINKVGVIDMERFQQESKTFQKVRAELKAKFDSLQQKLDDEKAQLAKVEEAYRKQSMMLSLDARESKQQELQKKQRYYKYLYNEYTAEMHDAEADARKKVGKAVQKIVGDIGEKGGYVLIIEKQSPGLIYYDDAVDITDKVVKAYDKANQSK